MANEGSNIRIGAGKVGGYLFSAPAGTELPADASTALDAAFVGLGYVSSDGITRSVEVSTEDVQDLNLDVVRTISTDVSVQASCVLLEVNEAVAKELYGEDNVSVVAADATHGAQINVSFTGEELPRKVYVVELVDGENLGRFVIGDGQVTTPGGGEIVFAKNQAIQHNLTIRAYRASSGEYFTHFTDDGQVSA